MHTYMHTYFFYAPVSLACSWVAPPTCRSWISVKVITLTTQQRLMAPRSDVSHHRSCKFLQNNKNCHSYSCASHRSSQRQGEEKKRKKKRGPAASFLSFAEISERKGRHDTSAYLGPARAVSSVCVSTCVCFWSGKGLTEAEIQMAVRGVGGVISWQYMRSCLWITTLSFLQNIQPSSAHSPRLSSWHPLPLEGFSATKLQSLLQLGN